MTFLYTPLHSSGETKTGIPPMPTSLKERRSGRCQGRAAGPEPRAAAGKHGEDLPLTAGGRGGATLFVGWCGGVEGPVFHHKQSVTFLKDVC